MTAIRSYLRLDSVRARARPAEFKLGKSLAALGEVEIIARDGEHVLAKAGKKSDFAKRRQVELRATSAGLSWRCTCLKTGTFCKHAVATAIIAIA